MLSLYCAGRGTCARVRRQYPRRLTQRPTAMTPILLQGRPSPSPELPFFSQVSPSPAVASAWVSRWGRALAWLLIAAQLAVLVPAAAQDAQGRSVRAVGPDVRIDVPLEQGSGAGAAGSVPSGGGAMAVGAEGARRQTLRAQVAAL